MVWSSISPNGNFSLLNVSQSQLWLPPHPDYARVNVEKRSDWVKLISELNHFRLDHLYSDVLNYPPLSSRDTINNYLFHYIDNNVVVLEQLFDRQNPNSNIYPHTHARHQHDDDYDGINMMISGEGIGDNDTMINMIISSLNSAGSPMASLLVASSSPSSSSSSSSSTTTSIQPLPSITRHRYVVFANLGNQTVVKDFSDKFHFSITQLATNVNRTNEFLIMRTLKLDPGEALIVTVEWL